MKHGFISWKSRPWKRDPSNDCNRFFLFLSFSADHDAAPNRRQMARREDGRMAPTLIFVLISICVILFPVKGMPLCRWLFSMNANFSITLTALLFCRVLRSGPEIKLFRPVDFQTAWIFAAVAGLILFPMALGAGPFDPYAAGWAFSWLSVTILALTIVLAFLKNRFAVVLLLAVLAWNFHLLESRNLWDYLLDPFLPLAPSSC